MRRSGHLPAARLPDEQPATEGTRLRGWRGHLSEVSDSSLVEHAETEQNGSCIKGSHLGFFANKHKDDIMMFSGCKIILHTLNISKHLPGFFGVFCCADRRSTRFHLCSSIRRRRHQRVWLPAARGGNSAHLKGGPRLSQHQRRSKVRHLSKRRKRNRTLSTIDCQHIDRIS